MQNEAEVQQNAASQADPIGIKVQEEDQAPKAEEPKTEAADGQKAEQPAKDDRRIAEPEKVVPDDGIFEPFFSAAQIVRYDALFKKYAGSSSPEYARRAYHEAVEFLLQPDDPEPGEEAQVRYALRKADNAKLPQELNATCRGRMELALNIFRDTAPGMYRGEQRHGAVENGRPPGATTMPRPTVLPQTSGSRSSSRSSTPIPMRRDVNAMRLLPRRIWKGFFPTAG